jgi:putative endonuclease
MADSTTAAPACTRSAAPDRHPPKGAGQPARHPFAVRRPASTARAHAGTPAAEPNHLAGISRRAAKPLAVPEAWVYLLRCADGSLYTGWTIDLDARVRRHGAGTASAYTRSRRPVELALALPMADRTAARREEARIKALDRRAKLALIADAPA